ncbi:MAG: hypothetical protein REI78_11145 [Pedobacter sp.]|nr:hypothetical protein [Pedobacter sp.]MDQ8053577.1 hypothetical protein [Pedobacter sp.]
MRKVCWIFVLCCSATATFAQNVAVVNGKSISSKEFMWVYKKNHAGITNASYQELANYLDLYINFKLKVLDAKAMNLDADTAYKKEVNGYETALKAQKKTAKNLAYDFIINEYREGVLMFNVSEKKIWSNVVDHEQEVRDYYQKNSAKYMGKNFEDVQGQVVADYQQQLEADWIKALRAKYSIKINEDELKKLAKP